MWGKKREGKAAVGVVPESGAVLIFLSPKGSPPQLLVGSAARGPRGAGEGGYF